MGSSLQKQCCGGRDDDTVKTEAKKMNDDAFAFLSGKGGIGNDLTRYEDARLKDDIPALVQLLDSNQEIREANVEHPWATPASTIGALAALHLASKASPETEAGEDAKKQIHNAGGIQKLVSMLSSDKPDKRDASIVCIAFVSRDNTENCEAIFDAGGFVPLIECMKMPHPEPRAAAADTARSVFVLDVIHRQAFVAAGGVPPLVAMLDLPKGPYDATKLYSQAEAIVHIEDLILENNRELPEIIAEVKKAGAVRRLEALKKVEVPVGDTSGEPSISEEAHQLLVRLAD